MDRERLMNGLDRLYLPKREMLSRIPLGVSLDACWQELVNRRRSKATRLPMRGTDGENYWFVVTDSMVTASEKIVEEAMLPYQSADMAVLEESFYTSFVEGSPMTIEEAMAYIRQNNPPQDIHEQMLQNNRQAIAFAMEHAYLPLTEEMICTLASILTAEMDGGGGTYRTDDKHTIPFMGGEPYSVPPAAGIPGMMRDFVIYLLDPGVHPLLKAAVAHAWFMIVRPFNEGNERLARLVAAMVLIRARYTFFTEVSLSALIAMDGYGYYDAVANVLRESDTGDWTYLVEYYVALLGKAIDEIHRRRQEKEVELARQTLTPAFGQNAAVDSQTSPTEKAGYSAVQAQETTQPAVVEITTEKYDEEEEWDDSAESVLAKAGFVTMDLAQDSFDEKETSDPDQMSFAELVERLKAMAERPSELYSAVAHRMLEYIENGKYAFTRAELADGIAVDSKQSHNIIGYLRSRGYIVSGEMGEGRVVIYRFNFAEGYSENVLSLISHLASSKISPKDKRVGEIMLQKLDTG